MFFNIINMKIIIKKFKDLTLEQLYKILKLRFDVFVVEQNSIYDEYDNEDYRAIHFFIENKNEVIAYLRVYKKSKLIASLGRVVIHKDYRSKGLVRRIVQKAIDYVSSNLEVSKIKIGAQDYLKKFYESYGFKQESYVYDDGGVPHIDMILDV